MLNHLPKTINEEAQFVSFDVANLYTSIPHNYAIEAIGLWLTKHPGALPKCINTTFIIESLKFILQNNYFIFNDAYYRQKCGIAMGTKAAPVFANLIMGYFELTLYEISLQKYGSPFYSYITENWKRYLDDCFIISQENIDKLWDFKSTLNSLNSNIQFTMELSKEQLPFLDIMIKKVNNQITTDIYQKPTDSKQYLLFKSCHPKHIKLNIPYNLAKRICTIVSDKTTQDLRLQDLKRTLIERQYPPSLIDLGINKAKKLDPKTLKTPKQTTTSQLKTLLYISTHNPRNSEAYNTIIQNLPLLTSDPKMHDIIKTHKLIKCKKQHKSLKRLLTNAKLYKTTTKPEVKRCGRPNCGTCPHLLEGSVFLFKQGESFTIKTNFTCASENLIYAITCSGCGHNYLGQTSISLRKRTTLHKEQIRFPQYRQIPLSGHLERCARNITPIFTIFPFFKLKDAISPEERLNKEAYFIQKYGPRLNKHA